MNTIIRSLLSVILLLAPLCNLRGQILLPILAGTPSGGGITPISLLGGGNGFVYCNNGMAGGCTTSAINTTGAKLLVALDCDYLGAANYNFSDSKSNSWTDLTEYSIGSQNCKFRYATNPTVGSGHTFQDIGTFGMVAVLAFAGADTSSPYVTSSDVGANSVSCDSGGSGCFPGSVSIAEGNVEVTAFIIGNQGFTGTLTDDTDYTIDASSNNQPPDSSINGFTIAHFIAATTASRNPAWRPSTGNQTVTVMAATFKHQ